MFIMNVLFLVARFQSYLFWWKFIDLDAFRKNVLPSQIFLSLIPLRSKCGERDELSPKRIKVEV